jgi:hypothetical protein
MPINLAHPTVFGVLHLSGAVKIEIDKKKSISHQLFAAATGDEGRRNVNGITFHAARFVGVRKFAATFAVTLARCSLARTENATKMD